MDALIEMFKNVLVFVLLAVPGVIVVKIKMLKSEQSGVLSKVLQYIGLPFLVLSSTLNVEFNKEFLKVIGISAAISSGFTMMMYFLSKPLTAMEKDERKRGMMRFCQIATNNGFLGIPLAVAVFADRPLVVTSLIIVNIVSLIFFNTFGIYLVSGNKSAIQAKKALLNPVLIAFVLGIVLNLLDVKTHVEEVSTYAGYLGGLVTPLCMLILGMKLGDAPIKPLFTTWKSYYVAAIKLVLVPVLVVAVTLLLRQFFAIGDDVVFGLFIGFALSTATLGIVFADNYGGDTENGVIFTLGNTLLSIVSVPILYWLLVAIL